MEAKAFISQKHAEAVEALRAIEAEYMPRREAAQATIAMTDKWLEELGGEKAAPAEPELSLQDVAKSAAGSWMSNRDLNPGSRQG